MKPQILILAAGSSSRMRGRDKLLEQIDGAALLTQVTKAALGTRCPVTVALPPENPGRNQALEGLDIRRVAVPDPTLGMAESLKAGVAGLPPDAAILLLLADLPEITTADLNAFINAWSKTPVIILRGAAEDGTPGHPVGFPPWTRPDLLALSGDQGARQVLMHHKDRLRLLQLPSQHATTDLDTPEDWAEWRAARQIGHEG